jgi:putative transposase
MVNTYQAIFVGDVSSVKLARTRMGKSVLDSGCGLLRMQLQYKGQQAGRRVEVVSEKHHASVFELWLLNGPQGS